MRRSTTKSVDEILVSLKRACFKVHVQQGISWSEKTIDSAARGWRFEFTGLDKELIGIKEITKLPGTMHGLMTFCELRGVVPSGFSCNFEMLEVAGPRFHGVSRDKGVPVQFVDREIAMLDAGQDGSQFHALNVRHGAELPAIEGRCDA